LGFSRRKIVPALLSNVPGWRQNNKASGDKFVRAKILSAAVTMLALVFGTMASGIYTPTGRAFYPIDEKVNSPAETAKSTPRTIYDFAMRKNYFNQISGLRVADW
jgi:hypothetical protein